MKQRSRFTAFLKTHRKHIFPTIVIFLFILLVALRISGTSIGIYHQYLYGAGTKDSSLLFGRPQGVRSDEWLVTTQLTIAQASNNFTENNDNYTEPKNLGIITDAPYFDWSILFKPQNLAFFALPFEFAFAFKWWLLFGVLVIASYYFFLRLTKDRLLVSVFASVIISFAPFVFWWFQTGTIGSLAYGFVILLLSVSIIDNKPLKLFSKSIKSRYATLLRSLALAYSLVGFALILYPPFQVPVVLIIVAFVLGYLLNKRIGWKKADWRRTILAFLAAGIVAGGVLGIFVATHSEEIHAITNTAYPGKREVASGGFTARTLLVTYLQPQLQRGLHGAYYIQNQSESSNFIVLPLLFLIPTAAMIIWLYIKKRRVEWILVLLLICSFVFLAHMFIPLPLIVTKLFLLHLVPQSRLFIGLGLLGIIMAVYLVVVIKNELKMTKRLTAWVALYVLFYTIVIFVAGLETAGLYPNFISSKKLILALALIPSIGFFLLFIGRLKTGLAILALFSIASVIYIHPLYVGLGPIYKSTLTQKIDAISTSDDTWAAAEDIYLENLPQMSDREAVTGVNPYPSMTFWKEFSTDESIYNRYAHILLTTADTADLKLIQPDLFTIASSCDRKIRTDIDYILSPVKLGDSCDILVDTVTYPARTFYIYKTSSSTP